MKKNSIFYIFFVFFFFLIINFSFSQENIKSKKRAIEYLLAQKSKCFEIAYGYLMTAGKLIETSKIMAKSKNKINLSRQI